MNRLMDSFDGTAKGRLARSGLTPLENKVRKFILLEFARNGKAPDYREIEKRLKLSSAEEVLVAIEKLEVSDLLQKKGDSIISMYPFSALETHHKVIFADGHWVYALCATDALGIHFMLKKDVTILSECLQCGGEIRIVLKNAGIDSCAPRGIVEFFGYKERSCCAAKSLCPSINFFCSKEHVEEWVEERPDYTGGETFSLTLALEHGKTIFEEFLK